MSMYGDNINISSGSVLDNIAAASGSGLNNVAAALFSNDSLAVQLEIDENVWHDSNSDGLADGWISDYGAPSITDNIQKITAQYYIGPEEYKAEIEKILPITSEGIIELTISYESTKPLRVKDINNLAVVAVLPVSAQESTVKFRFIGKGFAGIKMLFDYPESTSDFFKLYSVKLTVEEADNITTSSGSGLNNVAAASFQNDSLAVQLEIHEVVWADSNSDGLADGWISDYGTPSITNNIQKIAAQYVDEEYKAEIEKVLPIISEGIIELTISYESTKPLRVKDIGNLATVAVLPVSAQVSTVTFRFIGKGFTGIKMLLDNPESTSNFFKLHSVKLTPEEVDNLIII